MIESKELRIGNLIYNKNQPVKLRAKHILGLDNNAYKFAEPIPLTEEWLVKFGFEFTDEFDFNLNGLSVDGGVCHFSYDMFRGWYDIDNCDFVELPIIIQNVHQLQNLYFALTGEELELKPLQP